jgi:hypothetical protein
MTLQNSSRVADLNKHQISFDFFGGGWDTFLGVSGGNRTSVN